MASSGGVAGVAADFSADEVVELADLASLESWVRERIPGDEASLNPLDLTGFVMRDRDLLLEMFSGYAAAPGVDALILCWWAGEEDEGWAKTLLDPLAEAAAKAPIPLIVSPVEATTLDPALSGSGPRLLPGPAFHVPSDPSGGRGGDRPGDARVRTAHWAAPGLAPGLAPGIGRVDAPARFDRQRRGVHRQLR
jgi:hypothetical protein